MSEGNGHADTYWHARLLWFHNMLIHSQWPVKHSCRTGVKNGDIFLSCSASQCPTTQHIYVVWRPYRFCTVAPQGSRIHDFVLRSPGLWETWFCTGEPRALWDMILYWGAQGSGRHDFVLGSPGLWETWFCTEEPRALGDMILYWGAQGSGRHDFVLRSPGLWEAWICTEEPRAPGGMNLYWGAQGSGRHDFVLRSPGLWETWFCTEEPRALGGMLVYWRALNRFHQKCWAPHCTIMYPGALGSTLHNNVSWSPGLYTTQ